MLRIAICDDEKIDREILVKALKSYFAPKEETLAILNFESGMQLIDSYENGTAFDMVFLDVLMQRLDGIATAQQIRRFDAKVPIVFLTVSPDYALESYDVFASGYLLKPVDMTRFSALLNRIVFADEGSSRSLPVKRGAQVVRIPYEGIVYIESHANKLLLHDRRGDELEMYGKLDDIERQLDDRRFLRCHQSYLVNMNHIAVADEDFTLTNGERVPIKVRARKAIRDAYFAFISEQK